MQTESSPLAETACGIGGLRNFGRCRQRIRAGDGCSGLVVPAGGAATANRRLRGTAGPRRGRCDRRGQGGGRDAQRIGRRDTIGPRPGKLLVHGKAAAMRPALSRRPATALMELTGEKAPDSHEGNAESRGGDYISHQGQQSDTATPRGPATQRTQQTLRDRAQGLSSEQILHLPQTEPAFIGER